MHFSNNYEVELVLVSSLKHIERFSAKRARWLANRIKKDGVWRVPLALDHEHNLVLDGQHRMEAAKLLGLSHVPVIRYNYAKLNIRSLRKKYFFNWAIVSERALKGDIYPYKTVKHYFPEDSTHQCHILLSELVL
ncbi:ParB N-terminal domain-containing protein [Aeromonas allosaccharophila]|uniref:ParB N-terminal domain-containing protein n=1 Tax=Aeromonas allosaccharophila TaxID=656 RepID=UPI0039872E36